ncbi:MAG: hypothetical protein WD226_13565 [Planctomycetota bacterium]
MSLALSAALVLQLAVPTPEAARSEYADWLALAPDLVEPFEFTADTARFEGVALGRPGAPLLLVTAFDRQTADPWVRAVVERARDEPEARALLERVRIVVLPALASEGGGPARFGVDFPLGWQPGSLRPGAADVPLTEAATRGLAEWLLEREELVSVLALDGPDRGAPRIAAELPEVLLQLVHLAPVVNELDGGWLDFARDGLGLWTITPRSPAQPAAGVRELFQLMGRWPRIEVALIEARPLAVGLWQVDLALDNTGAFPTHPFGHADPRVPPFLAEVRGVEAIAIARRAGGSGSFRVGHMRSGSWPEPGLEARGQRTLRLVVELDSETGRMEFEAGTPRLGRARLALDLGPSASRALVSEPTGTPAAEVPAPEPATPEDPRPAAGDQAPTPAPASGRDDSAPAADAPGTAPATTAPATNDGSTTTG